MGELLAVGRRQVEHVEHQRRQVVGAAGIERRIDQGARGIFRRGAFAEQGLQAVVGQRAMHAVAADQDAVVLPKANGRVVEAGKILKTDGAIERVGQIAAAGDVVLG
jgi:hypothetical protein